MYIILIIFAAPGSKGNGNLKLPPYRSNIPNHSPCLNRKSTLFPSLNSSRNVGLVLSPLRKSCSRTPRRLFGLTWQPTASRISCSRKLYLSHRWQIGYPASTRTIHYRIRTRPTNGHLWAYQRGLRVSSLANLP